MDEFKNNINIQNPEKGNCCGCTACERTCPKHCISMLEDREGFLYPKVDESICIDCGLCSKVCFWLKNDPLQNSSSPKVYAAKNNSDEVRKVSTSGGVFSAIAEYIIKNRGVVYGAAFVPSSERVEYIRVVQGSDLDVIKGSKYVQCHVGDTFSLIKKDLQEDKLVLFTGTPCHCSGLKEFLINQYNNLYIVEILCHSTPSPLVFSDTLKSIKDKNGKDITNISFRDKNLGWRNSYCFQVWQDKEVTINETYLNLLFKGLTNRPSCYHCKFTSTSRCADMTIGDYWNIKAIQSEFEDNLGVSCILINNERGKELFDNISNKLEYIETPLEPAIQTCMEKNVKEPRRRTKFWNDYKKYGFEYCMQKYGHYSPWESLRDRSLAPIIRKIKKASQK